MIRDGTVADGRRREPVLQVTVQDGVVTIDGAEVIEELEAVNGIVHVVDGVLGMDGVELEGLT